MKKVINTPDAPKAIGPYSQAILINNMLFVSGQIPIDPSTGEIIKGNISQQAVQVMKNIHSILKEAGMDYSHIVKTGIFLADMNDFAAVNESYASYFTSAFPARETIQAARLPKDAELEISVIAVKST